LHATPALPVPKDPGGFDGNGDAAVAKPVTNLHGVRNACIAAGLPTAMFLFRLLCGPPRMLSDTRLAHRRGPALFGKIQSRRPAGDRLTQSLKQAQALALADIRTLDHFVIAGSQLVSLAERGPDLIGGGSGERPAQTTCSPFPAENIKRIRNFK